MPANALADLQFDFFLPESLADSLWMTSEVRAFSADADRSLPSRSSSIGSESSFDVKDSVVDSLQAATTDTTPRQRHLTGGTDHLEETSRDEHLPFSPAAEYDSLSTSDRWSIDEVRDYYDIPVDQPAEHDVYHDGIISRTQHDNQSHNHRQQIEHEQSSTWSETDITIMPWTLSSSSVSTRRTTEPSASPSGSGRQRQINPPLTMHYADYVRKISRVSDRITTSESPPPPPPPPTTTTTKTKATTSVGRRTGGRTRFGVTRPSSRQASLMTAGRRTLTSNSSSECGRRCPRFRPGVRRQFCHAQFGESRTIT